MLIINSQKIFKFGVVVCVAAIVVSCGKQDDAGLNGNSSAVVATVDDSKITQEEVEFTISKLIGKSNLSADTVVEHRVIDSLVSSRAMAVLAENELSETEKRELRLKTNAYHEELLVKSYIQKYAHPTPVSTAMISDYYTSHIEEFGGGSIKTFDYIRSYGLLDDDVKKQLIKRLQAADYQSDFALLANTLAAEGFAVKYKKAEMQAPLLDDPLKAMVYETSAGELASLNTQADVILLRVVKQRDLPAKPISDVSASIRKRLASLQLSKAISVLSEDAKKKVKITLRNDQAE